MKLIVQATLFIIKELIYFMFYLIKVLIYRLIGKEYPTLTPAPDLDDWPPEGSMHFMRLDPPYRSAGLPPNTVQYEFAENIEAGALVVFAMAQEIIFRLCNSRQTLIKCRFDPEPSKYLRRKTAMRPVEIATQFLCSLVPEVSIAQRENVVAVLSTGCPKEFFTQYETIPSINSFIDFYLFSDESTPLDSEKGLSLVEQGGYQAELYVDYGPPGLNIILDPEALDITEVEKVIEDVCHAHDILLMNPPTHDKKCPGGTDGEDSVTGLLILERK